MLGLVVVATLVAAAINLAPVSFVSGAELIFGHALATTVNLLFGVKYALVVSIGSSIATYAIWQHLWVLVPFALEQVAIFYGRKRKLSPILTGVVYWCVIGLPIIAFQYFNFADYLYETKLAIILKYLINGFVNILLGYLLSFVLGSALKIQPRYSIKLRHFIATFTFFVVCAISIKQRVLLAQRNPEKSFRSIGTRP